MVDDRCGLITATATTPGDVAEPSQTLPLVAQYEGNTGREVTVAVADRLYVTVENFCDLVERGVRPHISPMLPANHRQEGCFTKEDFLYDKANDRYVCPAGQPLQPKRTHKRRLRRRSRSFGARLPSHAKTGGGAFASTVAAVRFALRCPGNRRCTPSAEWIPALSAA